MSIDTKKLRDGKETRRCGRVNPTWTRTRLELMPPWPNTNRTAKPVILINQDRIYQAASRSFTSMSLISSVPQSLQLKPTM